MIDIHDTGIKLYTSTRYRDDGRAAAAPLYLRTALIAVEACYWMVMESTAVHGDGTTSVVQIETLTRERVPELAEITHEGFGQKACCLCFSESPSEMRSNLLKGYGEYPDEKLAVCGLAVEYSAAAGGGQEPRQGGSIVGFCQLTLPGLPGDYELECLSEGVSDDEGHVDRIAVSSRMRGRGIGKKLLDWADNTCRAWPRQHITKISLEVVHGNPAQRLYERHGYIVQPEDGCSRCFNICCVFFLMRHCGARKMVKSLMTHETSQLCVEHSHDDTSLRLLGTVP